MSLGASATTTTAQLFFCDSICHQSRAPLEQDLQGVLANGHAHVGHGDEDAVVVLLVLVDVEIVDVNDVAGAIFKTTEFRRDLLSVKRRVGGRLLDCAARNVDAKRRVAQRDLGHLVGDIATLNQVD